MTSAICPLNNYHLKEWLHDNVIRPYLEAKERLNRAWSGVNFHCIYNTKLSLKERIISLLVGIVLLIPFFNTVVWKCLETFGKLEVLSPPYAPRGDPPAPPLSTVQIPKNLPVDQTVATPLPQPTFEPSLSPQIPEKVVHFRHSEKMDGQPLPIISQWKVEHFPDRISIQKENSIEKVESIYSLDWKIQQYDLITKEGMEEFNDGLQEFHVRKEGRKLFASSKRAHGHKQAVLVMKKDLAWVQQPAFTFLNLASSPESAFEFYGIDYADLTLTHLVSKKIRQEEVEGLGNVLKIETRLAGFKGHFWKAEVWVDPLSGELKKQVSNTGPFKPMKTILFLPDHP